MPRATRKTKTNSGNELSALPKRNTWLKNSALTPSAAEYDSTTVAISMIGAITARSSSPRIRNTRSKIMGMITSRSWSAAVAMSRVTAVLPPTIACAPGTACTAVRTSPIVRNAAWLSGGEVSVACSQAWPALLTGGVTAVIPGVARSAASSWAACGSLPATITGWPAPAGKFWSMTACPATESGWCPAKASALVRPLAFKPVRPSAITPSTTAMPIQTVRGRTAMRRPALAQMPLGCGLCGAEGGPHGPENPAAEDHQQSRQQSQHGQQCDPDADDQHRSQALGGVQLGDGQRQQGQDHGASARDEGGPGPADRDGHRLMPVGVPP